VLKDLESLIPPMIMAIAFVAVVVAILRSQNPQRRAAAKQRERAAEEADPRIGRQSPGGS
jgi:mannose/fructose/N-acetylgalactosamine-specific phosphotransferase system component IIC